MASNTAKLSQELINYTERIEKLREALSKLKKGTSEYEIAEKKLIDVEKKAKKAKEDLLTAAGKLNKETHIHKDSIKKAEDALEKYNNVTKKTTGSLADMATGFLKTIATVGKFFLAYQALNLVISAFRELVIGSVETFVKFEDTLGKVQAVTSATAADMDNISNAIRVTAVETRFTATEIAELSVSLGKLGATAQEIPDLLRPISTAAQAIGEDIAVVGEAILKTNNQFGIASSDSVYTAAIFADAINTSALSLSSLSTALQYVGPLASQVGLSLADTSAYMKVLADNGFAASKIGTGLRNIFIKVKEAGKPLIETLKELAEQNISLAQAVELVDQRSAGQLLTLLENIDVVEKSTDVSKALTQARIAEAAQMKTIAAQTDVLKAVYENLQLSVGKSLTDNEILLNSIGALDYGAEQLLRKQIALNQVFSRTGGAEAYEKALKNVVENGASPLAAVFQLLKDIGVESSSELKNAFSQLASQLNVSDAKAQDILVTLAKSSRSSSIFGAKLQKEFIKQGDSITRAESKARKYLKVFEELQNSVSGVTGLTQAIVADAKTVENDNNLQIQRNAIFDKYSKTLKDIISLEAKGVNQTRRRQALSERVKNDRAEEEKNLKNLENQQYALNNTIEGQARLGFIIDDTQKSKLKTLEQEIVNAKIRLAAYDDELKAVNEISSDFDEAYEKRKRKQLELARLEAKDLEERKSNIEKEIRLLDEQTKKEIDNANNLFELEIAAARTNEDIFEARKKREQSIINAEEKQYLGLFDILEKVRELSEDSADARQKFIDEANAQQYGEDQINNVIAVFDRFGDNLDLTKESVEALAASLAEFPEFETIGGILDDAGESVGLFKDRLSELQKQYGKNFESSKKYQEKLGELKTEEVGFLQRLRSQLDLSTDAGKAAAGIIDKQIEGIESTGNAVKTTGEQAAEIFKGSFVQAASTALNAIEEFNKTAYENTINSLNAQKDAIAEKASFEEDVLKSQLQSQLISQEEYAARLEQIKKKEAQRANAVDKKIFDAQNKRDKQQATSNYILALASIVPNLITNEGKAEPTSILIMQAITAALATAAYSAQLNAIDQRKFFPRKFAEGGMVYGPSHEQGGVPFTVQGRGGYEMEGGEYIVNKKAAAKYRSLLDQINQTKFQPSYKFATGGPIRVEENAQKQLDLLEAIAEATTGTAINTGRPVRAFVSSSDLQNDTNARRIKDRNSNI